MSRAFSCDEVIKACGYDVHPNVGMRPGLRRNVEANWPLITQVLTELDMMDPMIQIGIIATVHTETGLFRPIKELGGDKYLNDRYDTRKDLGNTPARDGDGALFAGEGYIQLTGKANHMKYGKLIGVDLIANPHADMIPLNAAKILCHFFREEKVALACLAKDWRKVRRIVNGGYTHYDEVFLPVVNRLLKFLG